MIVYSFSGNFSMNPYYENLYTDAGMYYETRDNWTVNSIQAGRNDLKKSIVYKLLKKSDQVYCIFMTQGTKF